MTQLQSLFDGDLPGDPLEILEEVITNHNWSYERHSDSEVVIELGGRWCSYSIYVVWQDAMNALFFSCHFDVRVDSAKRPSVYELVGRTNECLWLGHFDLLSDESIPVFRHTMPLRGLRQVSAEQMEDLVNAAVAECERFYPALHLLLWGGQTVEDALRLSMMETAGEA